MLLILLVTTIVVLVIACANVGNLTLTRLVHRETEFSIRAALGAPAGLLRRQLLAENLVLSVLGGVLGPRTGGGRTQSAHLVRRPIHESHRRDCRRWLGARLHDDRRHRDRDVVCVGAAPHLRERSRAGHGGAGGRAAGTAGRRRAQRILVVSQLAASFMLLIGAGLLTRTLMQLYAVDPGFDLANVLSLQAPDFTAQSRDKRLQFSQDVLDRVKGQSAVQKAAMASSAPLAGAMTMPTDIQIDGTDAGRRRIGASGRDPRRQQRVFRNGRHRAGGRPALPGDRPPEGAAGGDHQPGDGALLLQGSKPRWPASRDADGSTATGRPRRKLSASRPTPMLTV